MEQWSGYPDSASSSRRYHSNGQAPRDFAGQPQTQPPPAGFKYDQYPGGLNSLPAQSSTASPITASHLRDNNGDVAMHDAYSSSIKYPVRPHHHHQLSGGGPAAAAAAAAAAASRSSTLHSPQEPSAAAQRYSPMEVLSPTAPYSPYTPKSAGPSQFPNQPAQRQSPTRQNDYAPHSPYPPQSPYYGNRPQNAQLPPITPHTAVYDGYPTSALTPLDGAFGSDPMSPRRPAPAPVVVKGPVPEFKKIRNLNELRPTANTQPAFRRANPEGGFISVRLYISSPPDCHR